MVKTKLGEFLVKQGRLTSEQLENALQHQKRWKKKLGRCLVDLNYIKEKALFESLSTMLRVPLIDVTRIQAGSITPELLKLISSDQAREDHVVPLAVREVNHKKRIVVATSDPLQYDVFDKIQFKTGLPVVVMISPDTDIEWFIRRYYGRDAESKNYVSIVQMKKTGHKPEYQEIIECIFEDSSFESHTKTFPNKKPGNTTS